MIEILSIAWDLFLIMLISLGIVSVIILIIVVIGASISVLIDEFKKDKR